MVQDNLPKQVMTWCPMGRKKNKGLTKTTWVDGIHGMMGEMGLTKRIRERERDRERERERELPKEDHWTNLNECRKM